MTYVQSPLPEPEPHFVGQLTAPIDEAELAEPDPEPGRSRVGRGMTLAALALGLLVVPGAVALNVLDAKTPSRLQQSLAWTATVQHWWIRATAAESPLPVPSPSLFVASAAPRNAVGPVDVVDEARAAPETHWREERRSDWRDGRDGAADPLARGGAMHAAAIDAQSVPTGLSAALTTIGWSTSERDGVAPDASIEPPRL